MANRFRFVQLLLIDEQMTSEPGKNYKKVAHEIESSCHCSLMFLPHSNVICAFITEQTTAKWNLFVLYNRNSRLLRDLTKNKYTEYTDVDLT